MAPKSIETILEDGILIVSFNRPEKKNAISLEMMSKLTEILDDAARNDNVNIVVLTGKGNFYSSGADLSLSNSITSPTSTIHPETEIKSRTKIGREFVDSFIDFPKLLIAIVNGPAVGIAFTTLALCDLVYCSSEATFWAPFTLRGLSVEACSSYLFPRIMGLAKANEVLQFGKKLNAKEARDCNLVTQIYESREMETNILPKIHTLNQQLSKESIITNKRLTRRWEASKLHEVNRVEWKELENRLGSEDFINKLMEFLVKKSSSKL